MIKFAGRVFETREVKFDESSVVKEDVFRSMLDSLVDDEQQADAGKQSDGEEEYFSQSSDDERERVPTPTQPPPAPEKRGRGRPPGSKNKPKDAPNPTHMSLRETTARKGCRQSVVGRLCSSNTCPILSRWTRL